MHLARTPPSPEGESELQPPSGVKVDLRHPNNPLYSYNIACQTLCFVLVGSSVLARFYAKLFIRPGLKIEDYSCLLAWALTVALSCLSLRCIKYRGGVHIWDVSTHDTESFLHLIYFAELVYYPAAFFTKTSILCLIARIFAPLRKAVLLSRLLIGLMVLYYVPAFFIKVFRCAPIRKTWDTKTPGKCITDEWSIFMADCAISLVTDVSILVLPMPLVWMLKASLKRKVRIMGIFAGGILAVAAIVARTIEVKQLNVADATVSVVVIMLLAIVEVNVGLLCASLPILPVFYQYFVKEKKTSEDFKNSFTSTYHRLETFTASNVQATGATNKEQADKAQEEALSGAAEHQSGPRVLDGTEGLSVSVLGGPPRVPEKERSWGGDGILKTVDLEQHGISLPKPAKFTRK